MTMPIDPKIAQEHFAVQLQVIDDGLVLDPPSLRRALYHAYQVADELSRVRRELVALCEASMEAGERPKVSAITHCLRGVTEP